MRTSEIIINVLRGYLFSLDRSVRNDFNRLRISEEVREKFIDYGYVLSDKARVKKVVKSKEWYLVDGEHEFSIEKYQNELVVCDLNKIRTQTSLAHKIGVAPGTIANLKAGKAKLTKPIADALVGELWLTDDQSDVIMIASARDSAERIKKQFKSNMVKLNRQYGNYPAVMLFLREEYGGRQC